MSSRYTEARVIVIDVVTTSESAADPLLSL